MSAAIDRGAGIPRGPLFFRQGEDLMFQYGVDASNALGPRKAKPSDQADHPGAYNTFLEAEANVLPDHRPAGGAAPVAPDSSNSGGIDGPKRNPVGRPRKRGG
jgi:hypothetical protein